MLSVIPMRYGVAFRKAFGDREVFNRFASDALGVTVDVDDVRIELRGRGRVNAAVACAGLGGDDAARRMRVELWLLHDLKYEEAAARAHATALADRCEAKGSDGGRPAVVTLVVVNTSRGSEPPGFSAAERVGGELMDVVVSVPRGGDRVVLLNPAVIDARTPESVRPWLALMAATNEGTVDVALHGGAVFARMLGALDRKRASQYELECMLDESLWAESLADARRRGYLQGLRASIEEMMQAQGFQVDEGLRASLARAGVSELKLVAEGSRRRRDGEAVVA